jgi:putative membrane protein
MRYKFTEEGISMSWGILFRHEVILNYARIQDIHLRSNIVERWLGLARVLIQTASSSSAAEMTLEGIKNFEEVRDFLYSRMRGVKDTTQQRVVAAKPASQGSSIGEGADLAATLREVAAELRALREVLERTGAKTPDEKGTRDV